MILFKIASMFLFAVPFANSKGIEMKQTVEQSTAKCTKVWTPDVSTLSLISDGPLRTETHVDFKFKTVIKIITDFGDSNPYKKVYQHDLSSADSLALNKIGLALCLNESVAKSGPAPGGSWYFEIRHHEVPGVGRQPNRTLSRKEGVTTGLTYFILNDAEAKLLLEAVESLAK